MTFRPSPGIYDRLLDQDLTDLLARYPELRAWFGKLEAEEQPSRYAEFVSQVLRQALLEEPDPERRRALCNRIIDLLSGSAGTSRKSHLEHRKLVPDPKPVLLEITPPHYAGSGMPRPRTSMAESSLFTGSPREPQLVQELLEEMRSSADPASCQGLAFPAGVRVFHSLHRVSQHVPCGHDQRAGMEPQGDLLGPGSRPLPVEMFEENRRGRVMGIRHYLLKSSDEIDKKIQK
ncbi:MAG: hypothetical protein ABR534_13065 [Desulfotignum sp.]|nr:hypothetical protein [Desulfobacteraceae bacterium]